MFHLNTPRKVYFWMAISFIFFTNFSFAVPVTFIDQAPIDNAINPSTLIPHGNDNGLSPIQPYQEYGTDGNPTRDPVQFTDTENPCANNTCHFPTNKWFTDLIFLAKQRGNRYDDFRVAESPLNIRVIDEVLKNDKGIPINLPGLAISAAKTPFLNVTTAPTTNNLNSDLYTYSLVVDMNSDIAFGIPEILACNVARVITHYDQLSLTTRWSINDGAQSMTAPIVRGSPYITMEYNNLPVDLYESTNRGFLAIGTDQQAPEITQADAVYTGKVFKVIIATDDMSALTKKNYPNGPPALYNEYMIFADKPLSLQYIPNRDHVYQQLLAASNFTGIVRVAYVGSVETDSHITDAQFALKILTDEKFAAEEALLQHYSGTYPISGTVNLSSSDTSGLVNYQWQTQQMAGSQSNPLLMMAFEATQINHLANPIVNNNYSIETIRGPMVAVVGNRWDLNVPYPPVLQNQNIWYGTQSIPPAFINLLTTSLKTDTQLVDADPFDPKNHGNTLEPTAKNDTYAFGKQIARLARLVLIADQLGQIQQRDHIVKRMETFLAPWFVQSPPAKDPHGTLQGFFNYDDKFGGIISARAAASPNDCPKDQCGYNLDFYNGQYTDHHFHYGYFLYAAAVIGKFDSTWLAAHKSYFDLLARDIANPSTDDPYFPQYRYFDWFEGHAFANGLVPGAVGRNQESTSEGVNAWYGLTLWGIVTNNAELTDIGKIMTALEIRAAKAWTQIIPSKSIYDGYDIAPNTVFNKYNTSVSMDNSGVTGINWSLKVDHMTFFGNKESYVLGIQMLPYTPITLDLFSKDWVEANWQLLQNANSMLLNIINNYSDITYDSGNIIDKFAAEYSESGSPSLTAYWGGFQGLLNGANQWSQLFEPIMALKDPQWAFSQLQHETGGVLYNAMSKVNTAFDSSPRVKSGEACSSIKAAYCIVDNTNTLRAIGIPFALVDYRGIDNGETITNLLWWLAINSSNAVPWQPVLPPLKPIGPSLLYPPAIDRVFRVPGQKSNVIIIFNNANGGSGRYSYSYNVDNHRWNNYSNYPLPPNAVKLNNVGLNANTFVSITVTDSMNNNATSPNVRVGD